MLWCSVYLYYTNLLNKAWTQVLRIVDGYKIFDKVLKCLIYLDYWKTKHWKCFRLVCKLHYLQFGFQKYLMHSLCIREQWMLSFRSTYWLPSAYLILLRVFRFFLFFIFLLSFCEFYYLLRYCRFFVNT